MKRAPTTRTAPWGKLTGTEPAEPTRRRPDAGSHGEAPGASDRQRADSTTPSTSDKPNPWYPACGPAHRTQTRRIDRRWSPITEAKATVSAKPDIWKQEMSNFLPAPVRPGSVGHTIGSREAHGHRSRPSPRSCGNRAFVACARLAAHDGSSDRVCHCSHIVFDADSYV